MKPLSRLFQPPPPPLPPPPSSRESNIVALIHASTSLHHHLKPIHAHLLRHGLSNSTYVTTQLISTPFLPSVYALALFRYFPSPPTTLLFNSIIRALSTSSHHLSAINHYYLLRHQRLLPNRLTFPFALRSAAAVPSPYFVLQVHADVVKLGSCLDSFVRTSVADAYVKLDRPNIALQLFDETPQRHKDSNLLLWNVVINGFCKSSDMEIASRIFELMPERSLASWNSLIDGYMRNGDMRGAATMFERMPQKDVVSWTTMVSGLSRNGENEKALVMFHRMLKEGFRPNDFTVVTVLSACARIGALESGLWIHEYITREQFRLNKAIGAALVDMYSKCGKIESASQAFHMTRERDLLTWSAMISGFAIHGHWERALQCFEDMIKAGVEPDEVVFLSMLMSYSYSGMVERGMKFFHSMKSKYSVEPDVRHYTCIVDLFGRAGRLQEALQLIETMPVQADFIIWGALFSACRAHKNVKMAEFVSERLQELKPRHHGSYVFLANMYAGSRKWKEAEKVRNTMKDKNIAKAPGWSCIEVDGQLHNFLAGDQSHSSSFEIYEKLDEVVNLARQQGYNPETEWVLHDIEQEEKEDAVEYHSEKLALAFGLLKTPNESDIRIVKNLRVCGDCHSMMKFVSKMYTRQIVLRDNKRFHHFNDGVCSCGDYW